MWYKIASIQNNVQDIISFFKEKYPEIDSSEIQKVKDSGIGYGLSCSKELCQALGGEVKLISSKKGFT